MKYYPIPVSADTGALSDVPRNSLAWLGAQTTPVKLAVGAGVGAVIGGLLGKHTLIGASIGATLAALTKTEQA